MEVVFALFPLALHLIASAHFASYGADFIFWGLLLLAWGMYMPILITMAYLKRPIDIDSSSTQFVKLLHEFIGKISVNAENVNAIAGWKVAVCHAPGEHIAFIIMGSVGSFACGFGLLPVLTSNYVPPIYYLITLVAFAIMGYIAWRLYVLTCALHHDTDAYSELQKILNYKVHILKLALQKLSNEDIDTAIAHFAANPSYAGDILSWLAGVDLSKVREEYRSAVNLYQERVNSHQQ